MSEMNPAQQEAIKKAWDLLTEHFDEVLLVANWELETSKCDGHECWWHGGALSALGMASFAHDRLLHHKAPDNEPGEEA